MSHYIIGIDLGTTNSVLSYIDLTDSDKKINLFEIPQFTDASTVETKNYLSSFIYLGLENEKFQLPWDQSENNFVIGSYAQKRSSQAPDRTVAASKSWLSHSTVDRRSNLLPHNAPDEIERISPLRAAKLILNHLQLAWNHEHRDALFSDQEIVITIPASFDAVAKDLTREAALQAGYPVDVTILEEPQAALYSWLAQNEDTWRTHVTPGENILVIDVGGGTADFSLINVTEEVNNVSLVRQAVGRHLLVGGDNMDLALAHFAAAKLSEKGHTVDAWQNTALWHACRQAKEKLLSESETNSFKITIAGRGKKLIGNSISIELEKNSVQEFLSNGFFPVCSLNANVQGGRSGFQETGLPYETEAAVTKHLAQFIKSNSKGDAFQVDHILFNGGVFKSDFLKNKILAVIETWFATKPKNLDQNANLDTSVAKGAAFYLFSKNSGGIRIKGGTARSYYLGFESAGMAIPGIPKPMNALCIVPKGLEEGEKYEIPVNQLALIAGQSSSFPFYSSTERPEDKPGLILNSIDQYHLDETANIFNSIDSEHFNDGDQIPIKIESNLAETGFLEIWAINDATSSKWRFEFNAREESR